MFKEDTETFGGVAYHTETFVGIGEFY